MTNASYLFNSLQHMTVVSGFENMGGVTGAQCFYNCSTSLVGGNGTVWASSKTAYTYFRIDTAATPGYLTAA